MRRRTRNILFFFFFIAVFVFVTMVVKQMGTENETPEDVSTEESLTTVTLLSPSELAKNSTHLTAYGILETSEHLDLAFQIGGKIESIYVHPGSYVEKGQILALLEDDSMVAQVEQAQAGYDAVYNSYLSFASGVDPLSIDSAASQLETARLQLASLIENEADQLSIEIQREVVKQYEYQLEMIDQALDDVDLATQWAYVEQAEAGLKAAQEAYDSVTLRAPFAGEVVSFSALEGEFVNASQSLGVLLNRDDIQVVTYLSSEDIETLSVGNSAWVNDEYEAEVIGISSLVDEVTQKRKVRLQMNGLDDMTLGDRVRIEIQQDAPESGVTLAPVTALLFDDEDAYVMVYKNGKVTRKAVSIREVLGDYVEVLGLGDESIVSDVAGLRNGEDVTLSL